MSGPRIRKDVPPVDISPISHPRRSAGASRVPAARVSGCITAAPMPWTNRNPINAARPGAAAQASDPTPNSAMPHSSTCLRPYRSASRPAHGMNTASASRYTVTVHWATAAEEPKSSAIAGRATMTAVWSKNSSARFARPASTT